MNKCSLSKWTSQFTKVIYIYLGIIDGRDFCMWKVPSARRKAVSFALTKVKSRYGGRYGFLKILYELLTSWLYWATPTCSILPTGFGCYKECWKLVQCGQWGKCWDQYWLAVGLSTTKTTRLCLFRAGGGREGWPWGGLSLEGVWISADSAIKYRAPSQAGKPYMVLLNSVQIWVVPLGQLHLYSFTSRRPVHAFWLHKILWC